MCGRDDGMRDFVLRAIAAGAADKRLAEFAIRERERIREEQMTTHEEIMMAFQPAPNRS